MKTTANYSLKKPEGTDVVNIDDLNANTDAIDTALNNKLDKVAGKVLSSTDVTQAEKNNWNSKQNALGYTPVNKAGDIMSACLASATTATQMNVADSSGANTFMVYGNTANPAMMTFHRAGAYATYFGLDTDNQFKFGGWSAGANKYKFWTEANFNPNNYVPVSASCNKNWNWSGQGGTPSWVWGGSDGTNMYVYSPANFSVNYANSAGSATTLGGKYASDFILVSALGGNQIATLDNQGRLVGSVIRQIKRGEVSGYGSSTTYKDISMTITNIDKVIIVTKVINAGNTNGTCDNTYALNIATTGFRINNVGAYLVHYEVIEYM